MVKILAIDDEELNLEVIDESLCDEGYKILKAQNTSEGMKILDSEPEIKVILLDNMLPDESGIDFLKRIKQLSKYQNTPVIMQTAVANQQSIVEGINAGAYYYLTKPYKKPLLLSIVNGAINNSRLLENVTLEVSQHKHSLGLIKSAEFEYKTISEAHDIAFMIANSFPDPERVIVGLVELMINSIEHGNLGISYEEKKDLIKSGDLSKEIANRLKMDKFAKKSASILFDKKEDRYEVLIKDQGQGFDWNEYMEFSTKRASDPNGRGILMATNHSFDEIKFIGNGNQVLCTIYDC